MLVTGFPVGAAVNNLPANAGDARDTGSIPEPRRPPGGGNGNPLQHSFLENPMDTDGAAESDTLDHACALSSTLSMLVPRSAAWVVSHVYRIDTSGNEGSGALSCLATLCVHCHTSFPGEVSAVRATPPGLDNQKLAPGPSPVSFFTLLFLTSSLKCSKSCPRVNSFPGFHSPRSE